MLANERFGGRGHRQHLCKDCQRLPQAELSLRSARRNIDQLCDEYGAVRRRHARAFAAFLEAEDGRVREYARAVAERTAQVRAERRAAVAVEHADEELREARLVLAEAERQLAACEADGDGRSADIAANRVAECERAVLQAWDALDAATRELDRLRPVGPDGSDGRDGPDGSDGRDGPDAPGGPPWLLEPEDIPF